MAFETREEIFEWVIAQKVPECPYCGRPMSLWEEPMMSIDDGLGWGTPFLFVCFNDDCELFVNGRQRIESEYGRGGSYRCLCYPQSGQFDAMHVGGPLGGRAQIIDDKVISERHRIEERIAEGMVLLERYRMEGNGGKILEMLRSSHEPSGIRAEAARLAGECCDLSAVDALRNHKFGNATLQRLAEEALQRIHDRHFTRECPYCAEIVKRRALVCKHCGGNLEKH